MAADFVGALKERYRPSIFCFPSKEAEAEYPNYRDIVSAVWSEAIRDSPIKFRLMFPPKKPPIEEFQRELIQIRNERTTYHDKVYELDTTARIRKRVLDDIFMPLQFLPDIPSGILVVTKAKESPTFPTGIPPWIHPLIRNMRKSSIRLTAPNLGQLLAKWVVDTILPLYHANVARIERDYERDWIGLRQTISNFLGTREDPVAACVTLKLYADLKMQQGMYEEGNAAYRKLIGNSEDPDLVSQVNICAAFSDLLTRSAGPQTLDYLANCRMYNRKSVELFILCCLIEFFVRLEMNDTPEKALMSFVYVARSSFEMVINPFLVEQLALCSKLRHCSLYLSLAASGYLRLGAYDLQLSCTRNAMDDFHVYQWPLLCQGLGSSMLRTLAKINEDPIEVLVTILSSHTLTMPRELHSHLSFFKIDSPLPCKFVRAKVIDVYAHGFPNTPIKGLADDWNQNGERLFGAFYRGQFFDYKVLKKRECCVNEHVFLRLMIITHRAAFNLTNIQLLLRGKASAVVAPVSVHHGPIAVVELCLTPTAPGNLEIYGISFEWEMCAHFETTFSHSPVKMLVSDDVPNVSMSVIGEINDELVVGQTTQVQLKLRNNWHSPLQSLSLFIAGEMTASLIEPEIEDICGQYRLPRLGPGEEVELTIAVHATKLGTCLLDLVMPYWGPNPPPRYEYLELEYRVFPQESIFVQRSLSGIQALAPEFCWALGFTGPERDIDKHMLVLDGRLAVLNFVSCENVDDTTELPRYCRPFVDPSVFMFWYQNRYGVVCVPLERPKTEVAMLVRRVSENDFELEVSNLATTPFENVFVSVEMADTFPGFIVLGKSCHFVPEIRPRESVTLKLAMWVFGKQLVLPVNVKRGRFCESYEVFVECE